MTTREQKFLIARWNDRRDALKALVTEAEQHRDKEIYRNWRLKEFLAHMSGWDDAVVEAATVSFVTKSVTMCFRSDWISSLLLRYSR